MCSLSASAVERELSDSAAEVPGLAAIAPLPKSCGRAVIRETARPSLLPAERRRAAWRQGRRLAQAGPGEMLSDGRLVAAINDIRGKWPPPVRCSAANALRAAGVSCGECRARIPVEDLWVQRGLPAGSHWSESRPPHCFGWVSKLWRSPPHHSSWLDSKCSRWYDPGCRKLGS